MLILAATGLGSLVNLAGVAVTKYCSSLTLKVLASARNAAIVMIAAIVFRESVTPLQLMGYTITLVGFGIYQAAPAKDAKDDHGDTDAGNKTTVLPLVDRGLTSRVKADG
eukprot:TRINITY_DN30390_c0_g1_i1.p1 TRINITY_DN30390_c0_g1~~TRINITY_DN30390_c0_g1_i1.p1  ORF type:complete len:110 (+),score=20.47 TRINITY_DN30390_c0_g1_i1:1-330(+)